MKELSEKHPRYGYRRFYARKDGRWASVTFHGAGVVSDGSVEIAFGVLGVAAIVVGSGVIRFEFDEVIVVGDGTVEVALGFFGVAAIVVGNGVFWVEFDGTGVVRNGSVKIAFAGIGDTAIIICNIVFWVELDSLAVICDGSVEISIGLFCDTARDILVCRLLGHRTDRQEHEQGEREKMIAKHFHQGFQVTEI